MKWKKKPSTKPLAPELFEFINEYATKLNKEKNSPTDAVDGDNELVVFIENFMAQFSSGFLGRKIEGFNRRSREQLTLERKRLEREKVHIAAQHLIFRLEPLCDMVTEMTYGNSEHDSENFHYETMPELLEHIRKWLKEASLSVEVQEAAAVAQSNYLSSIGLVAE